MPRIPVNHIASFLKMIGEDAKHFAPSVGQAAKGLAIWGGGTLAATYGIQKWLGMDEATHQQEYNDYLAQSNPQATPEYREYYQNTVKHFSRGYEMTNSMLWLGEGGENDVASTNLRRQQAARLKPQKVPGYYAVMPKG